MKKILWLCLTLIVTFVLSFCLPDEKPEAYSIAFYNVENLFDYHDDPDVNDDDFLPGGKCHWTQNRYEKKLNQIATVASKLGDSDGPELLGMAEIENSHVLKDLINISAFAAPYGFIHQESCDNRGIDVALLYKKKIFKPLYHKLYSPKSMEGIKSGLRELLLVKGILNKDTTFILVNHWTSRRTGVEKSERKRIIMGMLVRELCDSLFRINKESEIIVMGDFNDTPHDPSVTEVIMAKGNAEKMGGEDLFNGFGNIDASKIGSTKYGKNWLTFDQIMMSKAFYKKHYKKGSSEIYHPEWMHYKSKLMNGPYRTFSGSKYQENGFSDHFPVYINFK
ncbi:hypothetical protein [Sporocytophaga myxococcoides]|uniref:endonuclease/exonuclease/phosphatase family protein n=1 Tax=Sporocytophaga myxococcoides TaxID=153721 RepID=UPI00041C8387|nr:hypothetical protein [Sporocytophaga myxococcoides]